METAEQDPYVVIHATPGVETCRRLREAAGLGAKSQAYRLYQQLGFHLAAPGSVGMAYRQS